MKTKSLFLSTLITLILLSTVFLGQSFAETDVITGAQFGTSKPIPSVEKSISGVDTSMLSDTDTYTFTTTYKDALALDSSLSVPSDSAVESAQTGFTDGVYTTTIEGNLSSGSITKAILPSGVNYTEPGIYEYTVQETASSNPNVAIDTNTYLLKVYVEYDTTTGDLTDSTLMIVGQEWYKEGSTANTKITVQSSVPIANKANTSTGTVKISKSVEGTGANPNASFSFKVTFGGNYEGSYPIVLSSGTETIANGGTFSLKDGESAQILNLPVGATVQIEETNASDYSTSITETQAMKSGDTASSTYTVSSKTSDTLSVQKDLTTVLAYVNTLNAPTPTAFTFANAPFIYLGAGIVVIAGAVILIVKNRKREEF